MLRVMFRQMKTNCTYCKSDHGNTDDHVPPKGFFQKPCPDNAQLITVPCCETCRKVDQQYDGFIRNLFCSLLDTEAHPVIEKDVAFRRDRSFERDRSLAQQLADIMINSDVHTQAGVYIGTAPAFNLDSHIIDRFIERVCRAVLFDAFNLSYFPAKFAWKLNPHIPNYMLSVASSASKQRDVLEVFHYLATPSQNDSYFVILTFYQRLRILGYFNKTD
jgi:hypothetical protein